MSLTSTIIFTPDTLRLLIIPLFIYASYLDYHTRRIYNEFWIPVIGLSFLVLGWDIMLLFLEPSHVQSDYLSTLTLSIIITPSIAYTLWQNNIYGGADLKAIVLLSVFFPQTPEYLINGGTYPLVEGVTPIFTITIIINALIISMIYQFKTILTNLFKKDPLSMHSLQVLTKTLDERHGLIIQQNTQPVDIDLIRMYIDWRNITLTELLSSTDFYRQTQPVVTKEISDGRIKSPIKKPLNNERSEITLPKQDTETQQDQGQIANSFKVKDDPWAATQFINQLNFNSRTNTSSKQLTQALDTIATSEKVTITPSIPFFIPLTISLIISITYGSLLTGFTEFIAHSIITTL